MGESLSEELDSELKSRERSRTGNDKSLGWSGSGKSEMTRVGGPGKVDQVGRVVVSHIAGLGLGGS